MGDGNKKEEIERSKVGITRALLLRELQQQQQQDDEDNDDDEQEEEATNSSSTCYSFSQELDDLMIRRFLRARNLDIEKANNLLIGFLTYSLDKICARMSTGQEKFVCIGDLEGWGYSSSDVRRYLVALSILQVTFVDSKKLRTTLLRDIDESQLPHICGGKLQLVPINEC